MPRKRSLKESEQEQEAIQKKAVDLRTKRVETKLSEFGALVSLAADNVATSKEAVIVAEERLTHLQKELEQLYMILAEPFFIE